MDDIVRSQIIAVKNTGEANMLDKHKAAEIALREGFHDLVIFLEAYESVYSRFILTGKTDKNNKEENL